MCLGGLARALRPVPLFAQRRAVTQENRRDALRDVMRPRAIPRVVRMYPVTSDHTNTTPRALTHSLDTFEKEKYVSHSLIAHTMIEINSPGRRHESHSCQLVAHLPLLFVPHLSLIHI